MLCRSSVLCTATVACARLALHCSIQRAWIANVDAWQLTLQIVVQHTEQTLLVVRVLRLARQLAALPSEILVCVPAHSDATEEESRSGEQDEATRECFRHSCASRGGGKQSADQAWKHFSYTYLGRGHSEATLGSASVEAIDAVAQEEGAEDMVGDGWTTRSSPHGQSGIGEGRGGVGNCPSAWRRQHRQWL